MDEDAYCVFIHLRSFYSINRMTSVYEIEIMLLL